MPVVIPVSGERDLIRCLAVFGQYLRTEGFKVTPSHVKDALRGLPLISLDDKEAFKVLLRSNMTSGPGEFIRFDSLFRAFWEKPAEPDMEGAGGEDPSVESDRQEAEAQQISFGDAADESEEPERVPAGLEEVLAGKDFSTLRADELEGMESAILALAQKLSRRLSRRYMPSASRGRVDLRRSLRRSLGLGGELIALRRRQRKMKRTRLHLLLDISGSMDAYGRFFLIFMYGLQRRIRQARSYVFSTRLTPVSRVLQSLPMAEAFGKVSEMDVNWSGGTNMGNSLAGFVREHLSPTAGSRGVVILVSDGWDRGDPAMLKDAMEALQLHSRVIIWLNPLLAGPGYEPTCQGARVILPWVDYFLPFHDLASLEHVCRVIGREW